MQINDLQRLTYTLKNIGEQLDNINKILTMFGDSLTNIAEELSKGLEEGVEKQSNTKKLPSKIECIKCKYFIPLFANSEDHTLGINRCYLTPRIITSTEQKNCSSYVPFKNTDELYDMNKACRVLNITNSQLQDALQLLGVTAPTEPGANEWGVLKYDLNKVIHFYLNEFTINILRNITRWNESSLVFKYVSRLHPYQFYRTKPELENKALINNKEEVIETNQNIQTKRVKQVVKKKEAKQVIATKQPKQTKQMKQQKESTKVNSNTVTKSRTKNGGKK